MIRIGRVPTPLAIAGLAALTAIACWPAVRSLASVWNAETYRTYAHGWLVLAVCVWLIVRERGELRGAQRAPVPLAWAVVAAGLLLYVAGFLLHFKAITQGAVPIIFLAAVWATLGDAVTKLCLFPVGYLYFAIPIWQIHAPLMWMCTYVERGLLWAGGITVAGEGTVLVIPEGALEIEPGCDGLHFLIVAAALATLLGYLNGDFTRRRLRFIAIAAGLAVLANTVRIHALFLIAHASHMRSPLLGDHYWFGWWIFAGAMAIFFGLERLGRGGARQVGVILAD